MVPFVKTKQLITYLFKVILIQLMQQPIRFLNKIPIIHLEAGLRTYDFYNPYPEEFIRQSISKIAKIHLSQNKSSPKLENGRYY